MRITLNELKQIIRNEIKREKRRLNEDKKEDQKTIEQIYNKIFHDNDYSEEESYSYVKPLEDFLNALEKNGFTYEIVPDEDDIKQQIHRIRRSGDRLIIADLYNHGVKGNWELDTYY